MSPSRYLSSVVYWLAIILLMLLFYPYFKSAMLAIVFAFAYCGTKDKIRQLTRPKKLLFFSVITVSIPFFVAAFISFFRSIFEAVTVLSNPESFHVIKYKIISLFLPVIKIIKKVYVWLIFEFNQSQKLEVRGADSFDQVIDKVVNGTLGFLVDLPKYSLQIAFFIVFFLFAVRKIEQTIHSRRSDLSGRAADILLIAGKDSGYHAIVTTSIIAMVQAAILTAGSYVIGIDAWPSVFLFATVFAFVPMIGVFPITIVCAVYAGTELGIQQSVIIGLVGLGASVIDNILRPIFSAGARSSIGKIFCFFALIGSILIFGWTGLFIGPFILMFVSEIFAAEEQNHQFLNLPT